MLLSSRLRPKIAFVAAGSMSGELGGAERFFLGVTEALERAGMTVDLVAIPSDESSFDGILKSYVRFRDLDLSSYDGVISSKAPSFAVRHPNHICYLQHTMRVFYDMFEREFPNASPLLYDQKKLVNMLDTALLRYPNTKRLITIGKEVADRLQYFNGLKATEVVHHPTSLTGLRSGPFKHFLLPGRLHRWKRVDLAIEAYRLTDFDVPLIITGTGEDEELFRSMAKGDNRIQFCGRTSDDQLVELYSQSIAVLFVPQREDMGLITFEAFLSGKPVITVVDSGEPANIVVDGYSGYVCEPKPQELASSMKKLFFKPETAIAMGENGRKMVQSITWDNVAQQLIAALNFA